MEAKTCMNCGEGIRGRIDKKFCDDQCRTQHNNRINSTSSIVVKSINAILKKNRKILEDVLIKAIDGKSKISAKKLHDKGYNFSYQTHTYTTKTGSVYIFCYEYGYLPLENDFYMVVKRKSE